MTWHLDALRYLIIFWVPVFFVFTILLLVEQEKGERDD